MTDTDTDPFAQLLAEALRAGPASAPWREALTQIGANPGPADEYQLLLSAREHLENGKSFREIRAGAGFTHKLMGELDRDPNGRTSKGIPTPAIIALIASISVIAALAWIGSHLIPHHVIEPNSSTGELAGLYFPNELAAARFTGAIPAGWRTIGNLPLDAKDGLRAASGDKTAGGGVVLITPAPSDDAFAFEVELHVTHPSDNLVTQIFVSTAGDFSADRATSSHELLWSLRGKSQQVVLDGRVLPTTASTVTGGTVRVRLVMNRDQAIVESNGQRLWSGPHQLAAAPRSPGVRFIRSAPDPKAGIEIRGVRVMKP